jgi:hypothetical protein
MVVNQGITFSRNGEVKSPMAGKQVKHMFKKRHTYLPFKLAHSIQIELNSKLGFQSSALDAGPTVR